MRHADFSIAPTAATSATSATIATRPTAAIGGGDAGFGRLFSELQSEVNTYIQHGDVDGGAASSLSAEGALLRLRAQGLIMNAEDAVDPATASGGAAASTPEQQAFLDSIAPWARQAARKLGVAPELVQAHAALESGWASVRYAPPTARAATTCSGSRPAPVGKALPASPPPPNT